MTTSSLANLAKTGAAVIDPRGAGWPVRFHETMICGSSAGSQPMKEPITSVG